MKKIVLFLIIITSSFSSSFGQNQPSKISSTKVRGGYTYSLNGNPLQLYQINSLLETNSDAFEYSKKSKSNTSLAQIFSFAGGFMVGWPLGTALAGGEPNWSLAGIGAGLIVISIPISTESNKQLKQAVDIYNNSLENPQKSSENEVSLTLTNNGVGFALKF